VWRSGSGDSDIFGQRFDSEGVAQGAEFEVNSYTTASQSLPSVASDANGNFVVVWQSHQQDGSNAGIFGQRYDSEGVAQGSEFRVNSHTPNNQFLPSVASDASGNFLVTWQSGHDGSNGGVFGQRYDSAGMAQGGEFQINTYTTRFQESPTVWATGTNRFVVAWDSSDAQDGSEVGVFGQRFDFDAGAILHAGDLDRKAKNVGATWRAQVKTRVHHDNHLVASGVLVTLKVSGGVGTRTCTTLAVGLCEVSVVVGDAVPSLTFTVTNLSKAGSSYDAGANHDPDPDSNGTVIVVNQP
jgi:hypothetical protein